MPSRLRSTSGCLTCRIRRVKCDEQKPICRACRPSGRNCVWPGETPATVSSLKSAQVLTETLAKLSLQSPVYSRGVFAADADSWRQAQICPMMRPLAGWQAFRDNTEHHSFVLLSKFLVTLGTEAYQRTYRGPGIEFTVGLQDIGVRDALLALGSFFAQIRTEQDLKLGPRKHYLAATRFIQNQIMREMTTDQLERLLIASLFLGMLEISDPFHTIFPIPHYLAVGQLQRLLHKANRGKILSPQLKGFHRTTLESYIYQTTLQSMFYSRQDKVVPLLDPLDQNFAHLTSAFDSNIITRCDLKIFVYLHRLSELAMPSELDEKQLHELQSLGKVFRHKEAETANDLKQRSTSMPSDELYYWQYTNMAYNLLIIFSMKISSRDMHADDPRLRPLVSAALSRLEACKPNKVWLGDYVWIFAVLFCAGGTTSEYEILAKELSRFTRGFWYGDAYRAKETVSRIKNAQKACLTSSGVDFRGEKIHSTLDLLLKGRLSLCKD